jgi:hypothetical protein
MEEKVKEFKQLWNRKYSYISLELEDYEIAEFIGRCSGSVEMAAEGASDYLLSQGLAEVDE